MIFLDAFYDFLILITSLDLFVYFMAAMMLLAVVGLTIKLIRGR